MHTPYNDSYKKYNILGFNTSEAEIIDLFKAWLAISIAFAIVMTRGHLTTSSFFLNLLAALFTVGIGFMLHELGHKAVAQKFGCFAEFRANNQMLVLAIAVSFLGFIFAAPGAVVIAGKHIYGRRNGLISMAGPLMNIVLALMFLAANLYMPNTIFRYGFMINIWIALFNMLPFSIIDGAKIYQWSKAVYLSMVIVILALIFAGGSSWA